MRTHTPIHSSFSSFWPMSIAFRWFSALWNAKPAGVLVKCPKQNEEREKKPIHYELACKHHIHNKLRIKLKKKKQQILSEKKAICSRWFLKRKKKMHLCCGGCVRVHFCRCVLVLIGAQFSRVPLKWWTVFYLMHQTHAHTHRHIIHFLCFQRKNL